MVSLLCKEQDMMEFIPIHHHDYLKQGSPTQSDFGFYNDWTSMGATAPAPLIFIHTKHDQSFINFTLMVN